MAVVNGKVVRPTTLTGYVDITGPEVELVRWSRDFLEFDGDLTAEQVEAIRLRMESRDDVDQAERAKIRAALDGGATNLAQMLADRELGQPVREPVYPQPESASVVASVAKKASKK